ncbi:oligosaccharide biosynthesis protein Alg14 [Chromohalobacter sp. 48-RD10]|uniref:oligosaccharide biosynthesis protein Alg14 n=1 Tax=Chromohalobacter sp. 48-RD10 TaxID=2994063 RepID=UPI002469C513|nr:oligosaccharide biosynthesis protein Alg14 [Chromohalobacter sp. 48-RD10]
MKNYLGDKCDILAVASFGGHNTQLKMILGENHIERVGYVSTVADGGYGEDGYTVRDCNMKTPVSFFLCASKAFYLLLKLRPKVVVTTGALPGLVFVILSKFFFAKSIWIDSIANVDKLSASGKIAKYVATLCLTQWEGVSDGKLVLYKGSVL